MTPRHFLEVDDLTAAELVEVLDRAERTDLPRTLVGRSVGLYFEKPSLRTRHSSEVAVVELGGHPLSFRRDEVGSGERESIADIARVLSGYHAALGGRVYDHALLEELAGAAAVPVVNLLSDRGHPCQALADLLTMRRSLGELAGVTVSWVGDFNNVARSLSVGATLLGMKVRLGCPPGYGPSDADLDRLRGLGGEPFVAQRPEEAVEGAIAVHTDVWASMGQESEAALRRQAFEGFTIDDRLMARAAPQAIFMHCLPVHRGEEVTAAVVDGPQSRAIVQAHNRLHSFRGLLSWLIDQSDDADHADESRGAPS
ncbi:MAG TPA: ornithine carbamoyltransferase [Acidimicrobiales bacterium]|nr:ornithine carbamoyltransferase [Acidimicrobiales bacterium]